MARKTALPDDDSLKQEALQTVIEIMRSARKKSVYGEFNCKDCGKRQRQQLDMPDYGNILKACAEILDRKEGKAATKKEAPKPKTAGRSLDELSDEELEALMNQWENANGEIDSGAAQEAAR